ncbi:AMP-dependent synthetase [Knoellia sinensis KCTC 19936]|uniref:AMP-dependent synthetase n=1 Tax=Knoellia sinensis KCTC 19936 TaxID=1385520 RepID=A0A0A0J9U7_9MICO|nr:AMP-binding protein [Knoellia sinensis]KGN32381.1 AMP-dependent synthetase [Knoellia sinensis KCTC 19936]
MAHALLTTAVAGIPFARAAADPHGIALRHDDRDLDNATFAADVQRLAAHFGSLGVAPGDTVAVMLPNRPEIVTTMFAAWYRGSAMTPINPALTDDEVRYQLEDSSSAVLVGDDRGRGLAESLGIAWVDVSLVHSTGQDAASEVERDEEALAQGSDFALIIYTSGTTGKPKGVLLDHDNLDSMSRQLIEHFALGAEDRSLLVLPLFHVNGLVASVLSPLRVGAEVVVGPRFSPETFWDVVQAHRPTYFSAVPTIYAVLEARTVGEVDTSSLRFVICGAAPMPAELITRFEERFGVPVVEGYGLSEGSVASTINPITGPRKPGTVGIALRGQEVAVVSPEGEPVPVGERGEVVIRGANVMRGYLGRPEETARVVRDGWLHSGDVGVLDEEGYLRIVDRIKDMIIRGGENIYPKEIEECLYRHPAVLQAAVIGKPDPTLGEVPVAYVSTQPGMVVTEDELRGHCEAGLARFKVPAEFHVRDELPTNSVGKLVKGPLRAEQR